MSSARRASNPDCCNRDACSHHAESNALPTELRDRLSSRSKFIVSTRSKFIVEVQNSIFREVGQLLLLFVDLSVAHGKDLSTQPLYSTFLSNLAEHRGPSGGRFVGGFYETASRAKSLAELAGSSVILCRNG